MKHCFITPTKFINDPEIGGQSDFLLALSHLMNETMDNAYVDALREFSKTKPVILDNGLFENGVPESGEELLFKAIDIGASYVFAPDYLYEAEATRQAFEDFADLAETVGVGPEGSTKLAYVVQANSHNEFLTEFAWANANPRISLIGLSILSVPHCFSELTRTDDITINRMIAMRELDKIHEGAIKPCHLLGLGEGLTDLISGVTYPWIYSNDSSSAFQTGKFEKTYKHYMVPGGKVHEKVDFDQQDLTPAQRTAILSNISTIKSII